jgi:Tfp pilus assembly protein PilX
MKEMKLSINKKQEGLVSIVVVMILMGIMVLVSTSFALLMRREQRQALDRQLSTQAFYAAESGVHDVAARINAFTSDVTDCNDTRIKGGNQHKLDGAEGNVEYTCVLVDRSPSSLLFDPISIETSTVVRLETASGGPISRIDISWQDGSDGGVGSKFVPRSNTTHLLPQGGVNDPATNNLTDGQGTGMLRATIMPIRNTSSFTRDVLVNDARTYFLYPREGAVNSAGRVDGVADNAQFVDGNCNTGSRPYFCNARITNLTTTNTGVIYLRLKSIYRPTAVSIRIFSADGTQTDIINSQAVIDSTGKAADVLRRIQVRVPLKGDYLFPEHAITSLDTICKRLGFTGSGAAPIVDMPTPSSSPSDWQNIDYNQNIDQQLCSP